MFLGEEKMPKISVIIPVYNVEQYLRKCLDSVVTQTFKDIEIICINDGSTDGSLEILKEYANKDSRIVLIDTENKGQAAARNIGLKKANGEYIAFVDSDDYIEKETYEFAMKYIKSADIIVWGIKVFGEHALEQRKSDNKYYQLKYKGTIKTSTDVILKTDCSVCNKLFKNEILRKKRIIFPEGLHYEDALFWMEYAINSNNIHFIDAYFYNYRRRQDSTMSKTFKRGDYAIEHLYIIDEFFKYLKMHEKFSKEIDLFVSVFKSYFYFAYSFSPNDKQQEVLEKATNYALTFFKGTKVRNRFISLLQKKDYEKLFEPELTFWETLFCLKNMPKSDKNYKWKLICLLGFKFKIKLKIKNKQ